MFKIYFLFIFFFLLAFHTFADPIDFSSIQKLDIIKKYPELLILLKKHLEYLEKKNSRLREEVAGEINFSEYFETNNVGKNLIKELEKIIFFYKARCDFTNSQFPEGSIEFFNNVNQQNTDQIKNIISRIRQKTSTYKDYFLAKEYLLSYYDVLTLKEAELRFTDKITNEVAIENAKNDLVLNDISQNIQVRQDFGNFIFEYHPTGVISSSSGGVNTGRDAGSNTVYNRNFSTLHSTILEFKDKDIASFDCAL
ncbi:MAG: hypothetical protein QE271_01610 [Bacteriovoracaceae bacterium]|nr:hypothetical protein [Bacteriovoracaceae bacterium]